MPTAHPRGHPRLAGRRHGPLIAPCQWHAEPRLLLHLAVRDHSSPLYCQRAGTESDAWWPAECPTAADLMKSARPVQVNRRENQATDANGFFSERLISANP